MKKKSIAAGWLSIGLLVALSAAGGIMAFFTDKDEKINKFTVGKVDIVLEEPSWTQKPDSDQDGVPDEAENMVPGQKITKDPKISNVGKNDSYMFMTVQVPVQDLVTVQDNGMKNPKAVTELYSYTINKGWVKMGSCPVMGEDGTQTGVKHLYAYAGDNGECTKVQPSASTPALFDSVKFVNIMEGQKLEEQEFQMDIRSYGIQSDNLLESGADMKEVWTILSNQKELTEQYK